MFFVMIRLKVIYPKNLKKSTGSTLRTCLATVFEQSMSRGKRPAFVYQEPSTKYLLSSNLMRIIASNARQTRGRGLLVPSRQNFETIGRLTFDELSNLRHRGAFTTVSQTFTSCCQLVKYFPNDRPNLLDEWYQVRTAHYFKPSDIAKTLDRGLSAAFIHRRQRLDGRQVSRLLSSAYCLPTQITHLLKMSFSTCKI